MRTIDPHYMIILPDGTPHRHVRVVKLWSSYDAAERYRTKKAMTGAYVVLATITVGASLQPRITNG